MSSICGIDCTKCELKDNCGGCIKTNGRPFGGECLVANCCKDKDNKQCKSLLNSICGLKQQLIDEFNSLGIKDMEKVTDLNVLKGSFVNLEYTFPNGQKVKLLDDSKIYLGNQICKKGDARCYGLAADQNYLLVCEYGINGSDAEIIIYKKRNN